MRNISTCYILGLILIGSLLAGCKTSEKVISISETTTEIRHRDIPVAIPEREASVSAMINVDDNGRISLGDLKIENSKGANVEISITPDGKLKAGFVAPKDTMLVSAADTTKSEVKVNEKETEKKPSIFQRLGAKIGWSVFGACMIIGIVLFLRYKIKRLWQ